MERFTFVVQVHPQGISTLENLSTHELVPISDLATVGEQIERWLAEQSAARTPRSPGTAPAQRESAPGSTP